MRVLMTCVFLWITCSLLQAETITLSTYYPAPQGAYNNMRIQSSWCAGEPCFITGSTTRNASLTLHGTATITSANATTNALTITGRVLASAFFHNSDQRLKENIIPVDHALEKVLALEGVYYTLKEKPDQRKLGLIAQQIEPILPEVVTTDAQGIKSIAYAEIIGVLIEAIKEQQQQIDALKAQLHYEK